MNIGCAIKGTCEKFPDNIAMIARRFLVFGKLLAVKKRTSKHKGGRHGIQNLS